MVIEGGYLRDILDQPRALEATALSLDVPPALRTVADRMSSESYERIVLTGMGRPTTSCIRFTSAWSVPASPPSCSKRRN